MGIEILWTKIRAIMIMKIHTVDPTSLGLRRGFRRYTLISRQQ